MSPRLLAAAVLSLAVSAFAQQPAATGTVTGRVTAGDTQRPARFATVTLFAVPADATELPDMDKSDPKNLGAIMSAAFGHSNMSQAQTGLDGTYTATGVPPGDYYLFASQSGYITPSGLVQAAMDAGADMKKPLPGVPVVHVVADRTSNQDVAMQRGAAISGTIRWDDGSPVAGAHVQIVSTQSDAKKTPVQFAMLMGIGGGQSGMSALLAQTDDLGRFRVSGLAPGEYRIRAELQTNGGFSMKNGHFDLAAAKATSPMVIFEPAAFHENDGAKTTLRAGEESSGHEVVVNLNTLHSVSGHISSAEDHHGINSGTVTLTDASDKGFVHRAALDAQGNYTVTYLPAGTYNLSIVDAADTEPSQKKSGGLFAASDHTIRSYEAGKATVTVLDTDVRGQQLELTPSKKTKGNVDMNDIMGGIVAGPSTR